MKKDATRGNKQIKVCVRGATKGALSTEAVNGMVVIKKKAKN
jgi:hypothetical protein